MSITEAPRLPGEPLVIVTRVHIVPDGQLLNSDDSFSVAITDEGGGEFVEVEQGGANGLLRINPHEWPFLRDAIDKMVAACRS